MTKIKNIIPRKILNSKGNWTIEVKIETGKGIFKTSLPSGTSKGKYEAIELKAEKVLENFKKIITPRLKDKTFEDQKELDQFLINLDNKENKSKLGANTLLGVSIAYCKALAQEKKLPLYRYIKEVFNLQFLANSLPRPCFNFFEGGVHASNYLSFQEFMIVPKKKLFKENLSLGVEIYQQLKKNLEKKFGKKGLSIGDEGGFSPPFENYQEVLDFFIQSLEQSNTRKEGEIAIDCAANQFFKKENVYFFENEEKKKEELFEIYEEIVKKYPILFLEDPFEEEDWQGFGILQKRIKKIKKEVFVVGDDLTVTNIKRIKKAFEKKSCKGVVIKPNQIGTITEAIEAVKLAKKFGWKVIVSHRSGETCDDFIADFAVGVGADFIKSGGIIRGERVIKYNRLLEIEKEF